MIKFIHTADLHLGLRITRFEESACNRIGEARFTAIEQLRTEAAKHQVDFVLVSGDVFDDHTVSKTISERAFTLFEGKAMPCPVYIIPGNHDPVTPGGVWDREPWTRAQPIKQTFLLRESVPVAIPGVPVTLFPCPLRHRNSIDDPTAWIAKHPRTESDRTIRIGLAHGSLGIMPNLPEDDHLIRSDAAQHYGLDYLALGHWHKPFRMKCADRVERTAYSGTHEPMRFPGSMAGFSTGWSSRSADGDAERFQDDGKGTAFLVSIEDAGAPPSIETIEVGRLRWMAEHRDVTSRPIGDLISEFAQREAPERTLIRLKLSGVMEPRAHARIEEVFAKIVRDRYHPGSSLDADNVLIEPNPEQLSQIVGNGVLARVLERLQQDARSTDSAGKRLADHALKLLYRLAWEEQAQ